MKPKKKKKRYLDGMVGCRRIWAFRDPRDTHWTIRVNTGRNPGGGEPIPADLLSPGQYDLNESDRKRPGSRIIRDMRDFFTLLLENAP